MEISPEQLIALEEAIASPKFTHARARQFCGHWMITIYHRHPTSPTGVMSANGWTEEIVLPLLKKYNRTSPLSPTEGLRRF